MSGTLASIGPNIWAQPVSKAIQMPGVSVEPSERDEWLFTTTNGVVVQGAARLRQDWLLIQAPCPETMRKICEESPEGALALLGRNAGLRGGVRCGLNGDGQPALLAELPLGRGLDIPGSVGRALEGIRQAWHEPPDADPVCAASTDPEMEVNWTGLCMEAGWTCTARGTGDVAIEVGRGYGSGRVLLSRTPHARARLTFGLPKNLEKISRIAIGRLLLAASGLIRLVRPVMAEDETPAFEYRWEDTPQSFLLGYVLEALSVAADFCGGPLCALADARVATAYLLHRGWSSLGIPS